MPLRPPHIALAIALIWGGATLCVEAQAQNKIRTETIRPPMAPGPPVAPQAKPEEKPAAVPVNPSARVAPLDPKKPGAIPEIITDLSRLPPNVTRTRERILAAARTGDLQKLLTVMQMNETMPVFSFSEDKDPIAYWKTNYPDSDGVEILSILVTILDSGFVLADKGTPQEMYLWPYFTRMPAKTLTAAQKVELFRIITGADYKDMLDFGAYMFYRLGIGPDGTWHFFVAGD